MPKKPSKRAHYVSVNRRKDFDIDFIITSPDDDHVQALGQIKTVLTGQAGMGKSAILNSYIDSYMEHSKHHHLPQGSILLFDGFEELTTGSDICFKAPTEPPDAAQFLMRLLLNRKEAEVEIGDLQEWYTTEILPRYDQRKAGVLFWAHALRTIAHRNAICKWVLRACIGGGIAKFGTWLTRKLIGG